MRYRAYVSPVCRAQAARVQTPPVKRPAVTVSCDPSAPLVTSYGPWAVGQIVRVWLCDSTNDSHFYDAVATIDALTSRGSVCLGFANGWQVWPGCRMDRWTVTQSLPLAKALSAERVCVRDDGCTGARRDVARIAALNTVTSS